MFVQKKYKKASGLYRKGTIINKILISLMIVFLLVKFKPKTLVKEYSECFQNMKFIL